MDRDRRGPSGPPSVGQLRFQSLEKPGGGTRRLVHLGRVEARSYASAVRAVSPFVLRAVGPQSQANRVHGWSARGPILEPWRVARARWRSEARALALAAGVVITTDVRSCYPSIEPDVLGDRLRTLGASSRDVTRVDRWMRWFCDQGVAGIPIGPIASAVLAEAVLQVGDEALRSIGMAHLRWVDDVAIFVQDERRAERAIEALVTAWATVGLRPNETKTSVHRDPVRWVASCWRISQAGRACLR